VFWYNYLTFRRIGLFAKFYSSIFFTKLQTDLKI